MGEKGLGEKSERPLKEYLNVKQKGTLPSSVLSLLNEDASNPITIAAMTTTTPMIRVFFVSITVAC